MRAMLINSLLIGLLISAGGCEELGMGPEEVPPNRPRILNKPGWASPDSLTNTNAVVDTPKPEATPVPEAPPPALTGAVAKVVAKYQSTERATERARTVQAILPELTAGDITEALKAIELGRRLEAEVGMALITGFYTEKKEWAKIEDAYKRMFAVVPELRFDPYHRLEFGWTLMKMARFDKSLDEAKEAEKYFENLPAGQSTLDFQARLRECQAWDYEGLFRDAVSRGNDEEAELFREKAVQSWEALRVMLQPLAENNKSISDKLAQAEDHIAGFKRRN